MSDERVFVNDPIGQMERENKETALFEGVVIMRDEDGEEMVVYHETCDEDIMLLEADNEFSEVLDKILNHLGECVVEDDEEDAEGYDYDDEDEEE